MHIEGGALAVDLFAAFEFYLLPSRHRVQLRPGSAFPRSTANWSTCPERQRWRPSIIPAVTELPVLRTQLKRRSVRPKTFRDFESTWQAAAWSRSRSRLPEAVPLRPDLEMESGSRAESSLTDGIRGAACRSFQWCRTRADTLGFCYAFVNGRAAGSLILREIPIWRDGITSDKQSC